MASVIENTKRTTIQNFNTTITLNTLNLNPRVSRALMVILKGLQFKILIFNNNINN